MSDTNKMDSNAPVVKSILVVSAHNTDWIWRCSGTVARYKRLGAAVHIVCLSPGVRGESNKLLKEDPTLTPEAIKEMRVQEALAAGESLGCDSTQVWDYDDCMLECSKDVVMQLAGRMREVRPDIVITHDRNDSRNCDHETAAKIVWQASLIATQRGIDINGLVPCAGRMLIFGFEPGQTESSDYKPNIYIDITDVWDEKMKAMMCVQTMRGTPDTHIRVNTHRGWQGKNNGLRKNIKFCESFSAFWPMVSDRFPV
ncbi:MAG: PIG-L family deacetylase [Clostridiales bacterium]|nr:PIG-L family deacetylase [Clostridiales bacterium]